MKYTLILILFTLLTGSAQAQTITVRNWLNPAAPLVRGAFALIEGTAFTDVEAIESFDPPTELEGVRVTVNGVPQRIRQVSPTQVVFIVSPAGPGLRSLQLRTKFNVTLNATIRVVTIWPAVLVPNTGEGNDSYIPAGLYTVTASGVPQIILNGDPVPVGPPNLPTQVTIQGSGFRFAASFGGARVRLNGIPAPVVAVRPSTLFPGQDELVFQIPSFLAGRGVMDLIVTVAGRESNYARINIGEALPPAAKAAPSE